MKSPPVWTNTKRAPRPTHGSAASTKAARDAKASRKNRIFPVATMLGIDIGPLIVQSDNLRKAKQCDSGLDSIDAHHSLQYGIVPLMETLSFPFGLDRTKQTMAANKMAKLIKHKYSAQLPATSWPRHNGPMSALTRVESNCSEPSK